MDSESVSRVRRFNRAVTQRVGALNDAFLARGRSLGHSRLLWEIGEDGAELRELRARLDLDSGYLTRMLRSLEESGLVFVGADAEDGRVRTAQLTPAGIVERRELDRLSDAQAESMLEPLTETQRERLVEAMGVVERLLLASAISIEPTPPSHPAARAAVAAYFTELAARFDTGFEADHTLPLTDEALSPPSGLMVLARLHDDAVGVGGLKLLPGGVGEIKRVWVAPAARGTGLGRRLLADLETRARDHGCTRVRLDTNRTLTEAIALYRTSGYREVAAFNDEPYAHHWFEKTL
jgi:DNA-binding MarR family transcriptional regulator/GNAT superfamily N-acetyltransferase